MRFWNQPLFTLHETDVSPLRLLVCILIFALSVVLAKLVKAYLKKNIHSPAVYGLCRFSYYLILLLGIYISLIIIGIDLTGIAVIAGALSIGIGFGLQSISNNFIAGIIILFEKRVCINDTIQLDSGDTGVISEIGIRSTIILADEQREIIVPNMEIISKKITKRKAP
ncbi:MAG: mechanosensitive ion channel [Chlamydiia bacterium]|nr:mechanosensitive ion channel [Chlamydiia bacterium]